MLLKLADWLVFEIFRFSAASKLGVALSFFIYDTIKILLLLFALIWIIGFIRTYLPQETIRKWMNKKIGIGNFFASLFGAITPFCSCSSIPIFIGFMEAGVPLGTAFSFLITSPLINEYLVVLMYGFFGWKITVLYVISGMTIGVVSGIILGKMNLDIHLEKDLVGGLNTENALVKFLTFKSRIKFGFDESVSIIKKVWVWVVIGVGIGAGIHNYVPQESIQNIIGKAGIFSVPIATLIGVPMYGSCAAIVPIAVVLFNKGVPLGTALAFMMAIAALSLPEAVMLRRAMKLRLILVFFGITTVSIILIGYTFNILQKIII